jgi:hypothetical protein
LMMMIISINKTARILYMLFCLYFVSTVYDTTYIRAGKLCR